jgi:hypothetical protein
MHNKSIYHGGTEDTEKHRDGMMKWWNIGVIE